MDTSLPLFKDCHVAVMCNARPWSTALFLSYDTLATLGVLFLSFPTLGKHAKVEMQECAGKPAAITNVHLTCTVTGGCASPGNQNYSCTCSQCTAMPPPPWSPLFCCIPENNDQLKTWLLG